MKKVNQIEQKKVIGGFKTKCCGHTYKSRARYLAHAVLCHAFHY